MSSAECLLLRASVRCWKSTLSWKTHSLVTFVQANWWRQYTGPWTRGYLTVSLHIDDRLPCGLCIVTSFSSSLAWQPVMLHWQSDSSFAKILGVNLLAQSKKLYCTYRIVHVTSSFKYVKLKDHAKMSAPRFDKSLVWINSAYTSERGRAPQVINTYRKSCPSTHNFSYKTVQIFLRRNNMRGTAEIVFRNVINSYLTCYLLEVPLSFSHIC